MSSVQQPQSNSPTLTDRKHRIATLKDRLEKYKVKDQQLIIKEAEIEAEILEKERLEKEREQIRIEAEKQALILELQRVSSAKPKPKPKPKPKAAAPVQQQQAQAQSFFPSFGYPATVTEKEAIDWLRNGF